KIGENEMKSVTFRRDLTLSLSRVRRRQGFVGCLLAGMSLLAAANAYAADPSVTPAPAPTADSGQIEEVVVTARHREEKAQDVPIPMTVLNGDDLGLDRIEQIGTKLPSA